MAVVKINEGTATNIAVDTVGSVNYQTVKLDVGAAGASSLFTGTLSQVSKGTITALATGTITGGTLGNLNFGTIDSFYRHPDAFATVISSGTSDIGTIKAAVSGSVIYVTDLIISAGTATNVEIASGGTSTPILGTLHLATNGGAVVNFRVPISTASGSALVYKQSVNGPLSITALGYVD